MDYDTQNVFPRNKTGRDSQVRNMFRHGKVTEVLVDKTQVCVRVQYLDKDGLISKPLPVKQFGSRSTSTFWCPKVGDDVCVTMLPNGSEDGFVDGSFYNTGNPPPTTNPDSRHIKFADGTVYDFSEGSPEGRGRSSGGGSLTFTSTGPITIKCDNITITANSLKLVGPLEIDGDVKIVGNLSVQGEIYAEGNIRTPATLFDHRGADHN